MTPGARRRLPLVALILVAAVWGGAWHQIGVAPPALDVEVRLEHDARAHLGAEVVYLNGAGYQYDAPRVAGDDRTLVWRVSGQWLREIKLALPERNLGRIARLEVRIGAAAFVYRGAELLATWRQTTHL